MSDPANGGGCGTPGIRGLWAWFSSASGNVAQWLDERKILVAIVTMVLGLAFPAGGIVASVLEDTPQLDLTHPSRAASEVTGQPISECQLSNRLVQLRISSSERPLTTDREVILSADMLSRDPSLDAASLQYFFEVRSVMGDINAKGWTPTAERTFTPQEPGNLTVVVLTRITNDTIVGCQSHAFEVR